MSSEVGLLAKTLLAARRKRQLRSVPVFEAHAGATLDDLHRLESQLGIAVPAPLRDWLLAAGYGDIDEELSFREAWFGPIRSGPLQGGATFAQDILGNFYAFDASERIYFLSRSEPVFSVIAENFSAFVEELIRRDYKLGEWMDSLEMQAYAG